MPANIQDVIKSFENLSPPENITQEPFDYDPDYLHRLCKVQPTVTPEDLYSYAHDLCYYELQHDLFPYLLPHCLRAWQEDLMNSQESSYAGFVELFSTAMAKHSGFRSLLTTTQYDAVAD